MIKRKKSELDREILFSIYSPNVWTPKQEDKWLSQPARALRHSIPTEQKPRHVKRVAKSRF